MRRLFLAAFFCSAAFAGPMEVDPNKVDIKATPVAGSVTMLQGAGGNIGVSVGDDGVFVIDDEYAPLAPKIKAALARLSPKPLRFVFNTHWHGDHTGSNEALAGAGALIVAHDNARKRMTVDQVLESFGGMHVPAAPPKALPVVTFSDEVTFHLNGDEIHVFHVPNAHTDFIFSILGEETGLIGEVIVIALFAVLVFAGVRIAVRAPDLFGRLLAAGITGWIAFQAVVNMGSVTGLLPITGIPLPFVSYGGSSLVVSMAAIGVLLAVGRSSLRKRPARRTKPARTRQTQRGAGPAHAAAAGG